MILVETKESTLFECAWFVMRREKPSAAAADMLAEAERIVSAGLHPEVKWRTALRRRGRIGFSIGFFCGSAIFAIIYVLLRVWS
jgi:hypothetical protein